MSMGLTYKFFGFYISYTVNLPLSIFYLLFMLHVPRTFSPVLPTDNHPCNLHFCDSEAGKDTGVRAACHYQTK